MNITPESPVKFRSGVAGVECDILVTHYLPAEPAITSGPMEDAVEGSPAEFEWMPLHAIGDPWPELKELASDADEDRIFDEFEAYLLASKHGVDY